MAIFSEEFTASVKSKVDAVKSKLSGVTKLGVGTLVAGGVVGSGLLLAVQQQQPVTLLVLTMGHNVVSLLMSTFHWLTLRNVTWINSTAS